MNDISNASIVLKLNKNWQIVGHYSVAKAIIDLVAGESIEAIDINYEVDLQTGEPDYTKVVSMLPCNWDAWLQLPIRDWDLVIHSTKLKIRVPTVVIAKNYHKVPVKRWKGKASRQAIYWRDDGIDQYTGKRVSIHEATIDHVIPKSRGGTDDWENLVLAAKEVNLAKGNKLNSEMGYKLIKQPKKPEPVVVSNLIVEPKHKDWEIFIKKKKKN